MKILLLSIIAKCGVCTHVREMAIAMKKLGMEPIIGLIHNLETTRLLKTTKSDINAMVESLNGISHFIYNSSEGLFEHTKNNAFVLVHAHSPLVFDSAIRISKKLGVPFIITLHEILEFGNYRHSMELADRIIAIGPEVAKSVGKEYQHKVHIIFNGIDIQRYKPIENNTIDGPLRIIWIGRTSGEASKGVSYLAQALQKLKSKIPIEAKVIGHALGSNTRNIQCCGWVYDPLPYLQWSHIVFARGCALREGMACGNVGMLIGDGYGGIVEQDWFMNGRAPILSGSIRHGYDKLSTSTIVKDILYFHHNRKNLERARKLSRLIAEDNFDIKKMIEHTLLVQRYAIQHYTKTNN